MWDILLPSTEECMAVLDREPITKDYIHGTEYGEKRRTWVTVFEVPQLIKGGIFLCISNSIGKI